ncbi:MAG: hypothetical protein HYS09_00245 [Chloroflexi bacterium]|nr:hypothetical protein [Chloroflexota bacterium]
MRLVWPFLLLLGGFVFFLEFIADVGGSENPASPVALEATPSPAPTATGQPQTWFEGVNIYDLPQAQVEQVIDGETIVVEDENGTLLVRYLGADTPQGSEPCAVEATLRNRQILEEEQVYLLEDRPGLPDGGGFRYVLLQEGQSVDEILISEGLARSRDRRSTYRDQFDQIEDVSAREHIGCLWQ